MPYASQHAHIHLCASLRYCSRLGASVFVGQRYCNVAACSPLCASWPWRLLPVVPLNTGCCVPCILQVANLTSATAEQQGRIHTLLSSQTELLERVVTLTRKWQQAVAEIEHLRLENIQLLHVQLQRGEVAVHTQ
jgi:hypothetical protein